jgi:hypothetical protein
MTSYRSGRPRPRPVCWRGSRQRTAGCACPQARCRGSRRSAGWRCRIRTAGRCPPSTASRSWSRPRWG